MTPPTEAALSILGLGVQLSLSGFHLLDQLIGGGRVRRREICDHHSYVANSPVYFLAFFAHAKFPHLRELCPAKEKQYLGFGSNQADFQNRPLEIETGPERKTGPPNLRPIVAFRIRFFESKPGTC
jgi:hypothetical protein